MDRGFKWLLITSIVLNIFLVCAGVTAAVMGVRVFHERMQAREPMVMRATRALPEEDRALLRQMMRERAVAAAPNLRAAREARREAARLIALQDYNPTAVAAALKQARESEAKAREEIDSAVVAFLPNLDPQRRATLAEALVGGGRFGGGRGGGGRGRGGPPHDGPPRGDGPPGDGPFRDSPPPVEGRSSPP